MNFRLRLPRIVAVLALIVAIAGAMDLLAASTAQAQDNYKTLTRLGGGNRFDRPLVYAQGIPKWAATKRPQEGIATVMEKAGLAPLTQTVIDILKKGDPAQLKESEFPIGGTMVWMAFRRGGGKADIVRNVKWGGKKPFPGYTFIIDDLNQTYTFIIPKACANIALVSSEPSREKARLDAEKAAKDKAEADRLAAEKAAADKARLEAERRERERAEAERVAREKAAAEKAAAERAAAEKAAADKTEAARVTGSTTTKVNQSLCAPLLGVKFGPEIKVKENFKINPAVGVAINFEKGSYSSLFAEAEFNYYSTGMKNYFGASAGLWDITHGNSVTPSFGVQLGSQVWTNPKEDKLYIVAEGRIYARMFGEGLSNNYQFWAGMRYVIR
jgi:nucleoid-associated protein YgaU